MCIICVHYEKEKLTVFEALNNVREYEGGDKIPEDHLKELNARLCQDLQALEHQEQEAEEDAPYFAWDDFDYSCFDFED